MQKDSSFIPLLFMCDAKTEIVENHDCLINHFWIADQGFGTTAESK